MKITIAALFSFLFASSAWAWPKLGDDALFDVAMSGGPMPMNGTMEYSITSIDANANVVNMKVSVSIMGQSQSENETVKLTDMQNLHDNMPKMVAECAKNGGTPDTVTSPVGTFQACKVSGVDGNQNKIDTWYADSAFGFVKQVITNPKGSINTLTLKSVRNGLEN